MTTKRQTKGDKAARRVFRKAAPQMAAIIIDAARGAIKGTPEQVQAKVKMAKAALDLPTGQVMLGGLARLLAEEAADE